jgi:predicted ester cyclase
MGMAATGKEVTITGITYSKISDGQLHEAWTSWDTLGMLQQLGAVPEAAPSRT